MRTPESGTTFRGCSMESTASGETSVERYVVCKRAELKPGEIRAFRAGKRRLAIVCLENGSYRAISDTCPHEGASLSKGRVEKMWVSDEIGCYNSSEEQVVVVCPWHNFEYDVDTGRAYTPQRLRVKTYEASLEGEEVVVYV